MTITQQILWEWFDYNPQTGDLTWAKRPATRVHVGDVAGAINGSGYRVIEFRGKSYPAHRVIWFYMNGAWPPEMIDHINGNRADNRIDNLRAVDAKANAENQLRPQRNNKCGLMGVSKYRDKWKAQISHAGRVIYLGLFTDPLAAHQTYVAKKRELHAACTL
jgi:hypothetical protein